MWGQKWYIVGPLIVIILGHWSLLMHGEQPHTLRSYSPSDRFSPPFVRRPAQGKMEPSGRMRHHTHQPQDHLRNVHLFDVL